MSRWHNRQFKSSIKYFLVEIMVSVVDFAENYTFETQNEVQSMHWHRYHISILVHITYQHRRWWILCVSISDRLESTYINVRRPLRRVFQLVKVEDVSQNSNSFNCDYIKGTMKIHSICATNKHNLTTLMVKDLACFCSYCLEGQWAKCKNVHWIGNWVLKQLQPIDIKAIRIAMFNDWDGQWDYDVDGDALAATLVIGDNFVVNAEARNLEDVDFS